MKKTWPCIAVTLVIKFFSFKFMQISVNLNKTQKLRLLCVSTKALETCIKA